MRFWERLRMVFFDQGAATARLQKLALADAAMLVWWGT